VRDSTHFPTAVHPGVGHASLAGSFGALRRASG
jgi:hypothetical protein